MKNSQRRAHRLIWLILTPALLGIVWLAATTRPAQSPLAGFSEPG